jgi:hypothetical protein
MPPVEPGDKSGILRGAVVDPKLFHKISGLELPQDAHYQIPQGHRVFIMKDPVPEKLGSIVLTENTRDREQMGTGWVIAAGAMAGSKAHHPGGPICNSPEDLLYCHVMLPAYLGKDVRFSIYDREYNCPIVVVTDVDIHAIDYNPDPLGTQERHAAEFARRYEAEQAAEESEELEARRSLEALRDNVKSWGY